MEKKMSDPINANSINQADYLKLFMQELTYQDPLKPVDNREFMAQMAQFSSLQEARTTNEHLGQLLGMTSGNQTLAMIGKTIRIKEAEGEGKVSKVTFYENAPPKVSVIMKNGEINEVELGQISEVRE
jgi:flagellar basal-body rod modification protein FlgD